MITPKITLYAILVDKRSNDYQVLSDHPDKFEPCDIILKEDFNFQTQVSNLFTTYFDFDPYYVNMICLEPSITNNILDIPLYCVVPYSSEPKRGHFLSAQKYAYNIPILRKILNLV